MKHYEDRGQGPVVVFVHGHPFDRSMWNPQIEYLQDRYRCIAPDLRGYGQVKPGLERFVTQQEFAADVLALIDELKIAQVCLIGLSMGGQIAMEFARQSPDRLSGLILAATFAEAETPEGVEERNRMADRFLAEGMAAIGCEILPKLIGASSMKRLPEIASFVYGMICRTDPQGAAAAVRGRAMRRDYRDDLRRFSFPTLIVAGTDDPFSSLTQAEGMRRAIPNAQLEVFPGIGHMPNLEDTDRFNEVIEKFLRRIPLDARQGSRQGLP